MAVDIVEECHRRVLYVSDTFSTTSGIPGWKTGRGMIYIKYGAPDEREEHPSGGSYTRPIEEGGGTTQTYPFEQWRYRYIEGVGNDVTIEFVDTTGKGEYRMTADPAEKDKLLHVRGPGLTLVEQLGLSDKNDRFTRTNGTHLGTGDIPLTDARRCSIDPATNSIPCRVPLRNRTQPAAK